ncbi:MAG: hypothetical protein QM734_15135 [Cyclobacteriaceae bacterium]
MRITLSLWAIFIIISASGQKAPVRFIPIDSISIIPKVKLDFKTNEKNIGRYPRAYPSLRGARPVPENTPPLLVFFTNKTDQGQL